MKSLAQMQDDISNVLKASWDRREGLVVPEPESLRHANEAVDLDATVLYADLSESTNLVATYKDWFAAEIYKVYLLVCSELIKNNGGSITAFDGDRVMGIFLGDSKNSSAAKCGLQISHMVHSQINPLLKKQYPSSSYEVKQAVGIDTGRVMATRTGIWGSNDLVWVGRPANYAAKLCSLGEDYYTTFITSDVYERLNQGSKTGGDSEVNMWTKFSWEEFGIAAYKSHWQWKPS